MGILGVLILFPKGHGDCRDDECEANQIFNVKRLFKIQHGENAKNNQRYDFLNDFQLKAIHARVKG